MRDGSRMWKDGTGVLRKERSSAPSPRIGRDSVPRPIAGISRWIALATLVILSAAYLCMPPGSDVIAAARKRELPVYNVARDDKVIAISFDAAWGNANTMALLDLLDKYDIKTTFFVVGIWVEKYPELIQEIAARGHEVESHSTTHPHMPQLSDEKMRQELKTVADQIESLTSERPTLFRPPYGDYNDRTIVVARQEGYEVIQWNIDSLDWKNLGAQPMIAAATKSLAPGNIVLFHNDSKYLMDALPTILDYYVSNGYKVIPVSQILLSGDTYIDHAGTQHPKAQTAPTPEV
ncbi:MAG: polysaccharide deacetylase family protein [Oscillospiraceae bacterium]|nr:polysaccharide deacetylase family protein [Oscillospiraceae bacterium]